MFNKVLKFSKRGFTFLEVIIAIFVISIGVLALVRVMPSIISGSSLDNDRLTAAYLAQEGIEIVRNVRDSNWLQGSTQWSYGILDLCQSGCEADYRCVGYDENPPPPVCFQTCNKMSNPNGCTLLAILDSTGLYGYGSGTNTKFKRTITVNNCISGSNCLDVFVDVYWNDRGKNYDFPVHEQLYNWY